MSVDFDSDLFDAEVILEKVGLSDCTAVDLGRLLAFVIDARTARQRVERLLAAGKIPRPAIDPGVGTERRWSRQQVLQIVAERLTDEEPSHAPGPRIHGSKRPCPSHNGGRGANVSQSRFRPGKDVCRECERRQVRIEADRVTLELIEGDPCIGESCPGCHKPLRAGQRIAATHLIHESCAATPEAKESH